MKRVGIHARQSDGSCPVCFGITFILSLNGDDLLPCPMCDAVVAGPARPCGRCAATGFIAGTCPESEVPCPDCDQGGQVTEPVVNPEGLPAPWPPAERLPY